MININFNCRLCGTDQSLELPMTEKAYEQANFERENGALIQDTAFRVLSNKDREVLISHTCYDCQEILFQ